LTELKTSLEKDITLDESGNAVVSRTYYIEVTEELDLEEYGFFLEFSENTSNLSILEVTDCLSRKDVYFKIYSGTTETSIRIRPNIPIRKGETYWIKIVYRISSYAREFPKSGNYVLIDTFSYTPPENSPFSLNQSQHYEVSVSVSDLRPKFLYIFRSPLSKVIIEPLSQPKQLSQRSYKWLFELTPRNSSLDIGLIYKLEKRETVVKILWSLLSGIIGAGVTILIYWLLGK